MKIPQLHLKASFKINEMNKKQECLRFLLHSRTRSFNKRIIFKKTISSKGQYISPSVVYSTCFFQYQERYCYCHIFYHYYLSFYLCLLDLLNLSNCAIGFKNTNGSKIRHSHEGFPRPSPYSQSRNCRN